MSSYDFDRSCEHAFMFCSVCVCVCWTRCACLCVLYFIVLSAAPLQLHAFAFRRVPGTRDATEIATMADSEAKLAKYFLARQLLEDRLEQALDRVYPETDGEF